MLDIKRLLVEYMYYQNGNAISGRFLMRSDLTILNMYLKIYEDVKKEIKKDFSFDPAHISIHISEIKSIEDWVKDEDDYRKLVDTY